MANKKAAPPTRRSNLPEIGLALVAVLLVAGFFFLRPRADQTNPVHYETVPAESAPAAAGATSEPVSSPAHQPSSPGTTSEASTWPADLPPLPTGNYDLARPVSEVRADYLFAAEHPEVEKYVPCYCGCKNMGHRNNEECFVAERNAKGQVVRWEPHAFG